MKWTIGISALAGVVALWVCFLSPVSFSVAEGPAGPPTCPDPPVAAGPSILYYAPSDGRNLMLDEGLIGLRREGAEVSYVTEPNQFVTRLLGSAWQVVIVADVGEEELSSEVLAGYPSTLDALILRVDTPGAAATQTERAVVFLPSASEPDGPRELLETGIVPLGCLIAFFECRARCAWETTPLSKERYLCDSWCNCCLATCEQGNPCVGDGSDKHPCKKRPVFKKKASAIPVPLPPES